MAKNFQGNIIYQWPNIPANDPDPGSGSKGIDPVFLILLQR